MSNTKHTPGPWFYDSDKNAIRQCAGQNGNVFICDIDDISKEDEANARLIAAAPDMLDALKTIANAVDDVVRAEDLRNYASAAIAKAEGRE